VLYVRQCFFVDVRWYFGCVDKKYVCNFTRCAMPPFTMQQHVAVNENVRRFDVLMDAEKTKVLQKSHNRMVIVAPEHNVVNNIWYHVAFCDTTAAIQQHC